MNTLHKMGFRFWYSCPGVTSNGLFKFVAGLP